MIENITFTMEILYTSKLSSVFIKQVYRNKSKTLRLKVNERHYIFSYFFFCFFSCMQNWPIL